MSGWRRARSIRTCSRTARMRARWTTCCGWRDARDDRPGPLMATDPKTEAALALHRFGFGPKANAIDAIASDPRGALLAELDQPDAALTKGRGLLSSPEVSRAVFEDDAQRAAQAKLERRRQEAEQKSGEPVMSPAEAPKPDAATAPAQPKPLPARQ